MDYKYTEMLFKALADTQRIKIIQLLVNNKLCGCDLLEHFDFSQPTLSHHMKILVSAGIVRDTKIGQSHYYTLEDEIVSNLHKIIGSIFDEHSKNTSSSLISKKNCP
ncbi:ArsR/SmtB family transcription factor [Weissella viridescens]|uniref:ArsR/SmtB family transcription factor n=1 Tax=Weissella viridescens TaxID=1629 RepID=UPI003AF2037A